MPIRLAPTNIAFGDFYTTRGAEASRPRNASGGGRQLEPPRLRRDAAAGAEVMNPLLNGSLASEARCDGTAESSATSKAFEPQTGRETAADSFARRSIYV